MNWTRLNKEYWAGWNWSHIKACIAEDKYMANASFMLPFYWTMAVFVGMKDADKMLQIALWFPGLAAVLFFVFSSAVHKMENHKMEFLCPMSPQERVSNLKGRYAVIVFYRLILWLIVDVYVGIILQSNVIYMLPVIYHQLASAVIVRGNAPKGKIAWRTSGYLVAMVFMWVLLMMAGDHDYNMAIMITLSVFGTIFYIPSWAETVRDFREIIYFEEANS